MFQNSNSLPIALIQSLVVEVPGLKWGHDDTKDQMLGRALTYLVLYSTLGMMVRFFDMNRTDDSSDGHGELSSCHKPTRRSRRLQTYPLQHLEPPIPTLSPTVNKSCRPKHLPHTLALARRTHSSRLQTECREMNEIRKRTLLEVWIGSELKNRPRGLDHLHRLCNGLPGLYRLTRCMLQEWYSDEDQLDLEVSHHQCSERCRGRIVEESFGVCQNSLNVNESLYQKSQRIAAMMISTRTRNG
jgi:hypothetical protein